MSTTLDQEVENIHNEIDEMSEMIFSIEFEKFEIERTFGLLNASNKESDKRKLQIRTALVKHLDDMLERMYERLQDIKERLVELGKHLQDDI